ncbi:MAG: OpgC domain-containing protein, partial [Acetobacteraceae bacterium]|nr:OpgC domain-containing protein [Acetobacteraceae bacterium]
GRDMRVDFFRGVALWWIFTDHIPGDVLGDVSLRNFAFCDATEVFVLLAGYAGGLVYGRAMDRHGWLYAGADVVKRAWTLYIAHIFLFVVFAAQVAYSATMLDRADYLDEIHIDVLAEDPYRALLGALTLQYQPGYLNILPMYVVLLLIFAAVLPLLRWPAILGAASFTLYAAARMIPLHLPSWNGAGWFFNPLAWQLLFVLGAIFSYARFKPPLAPRVLDVIAAAAVVLGVFLQVLTWPSPGLAAHLPPFITNTLLSVDKDSLHPLRLGSILALTWLVGRMVKPEAGWLRSWWTAPFTLMGQHSLPVFCASIGLSFLGRLAMEQDEAVVTQVLVNVGGFAAMTAVGLVTAWYRIKGQAGSTVQAALPSGGSADTA